MTMTHKHQHTIPRVYLRSWLEPYTPAGQMAAIHIIAKESKEVRRKSPTKSFTSNDRYTVHLKDGERNLDVENYLGRIESDFQGVAPANAYQFWGYSGASGLGSLYRCKQTEMPMAGDILCFGPSTPNGNLGHVAIIRSVTPVVNGSFQIYVAQEHVVNMGGPGYQPSSGQNGGDDNFVFSATQASPTSIINVNPDNLGNGYVCQGWMRMGGGQGGGQESTIQGPTIVTPPASQNVTAGSAVNFNVIATGDAPLAYQWFFNGQPINGATSANYSIPNVQVANSGSYTVTVSNAAWTQNSEAAMLTITTPSGGPSISSQPAPAVTGYLGGTIVLSVSASGSSGSSMTPAVRTTTLATTTSFQWYQDGVALTDAAGISGSRTSTLVLSNATLDSSGSYACLVTNSVGSILSQPAAVSVSETYDIGRLINISSRAQVGTGANILITGFTIGGSGTSGTEPVLVRGIGPALTTFQVAGALPDPSLSLLQGSATIASNFGWAGSSIISSVDAQTGAFALTNPASLDSAIYSPTLAPGSFSAEVQGNSGDIGVALAEVYDATPNGSYTPSSPRLTNISTRAEVGTGSSVLIAGFVIGGSTSKTVLIRASGPALKQFQLTNTLPDPMLQLMSGSSALASNTGWGGSAQIAAAATTCGAFSWGTSATADSAILITLPPGSYTAEVSGASGDTGVALVEVYEVF